jgi:hypothetical protein
MSSKILNDNADRVAVQRGVMKACSQNELEVRLKRHFREVLSIDLDPRPWSGEDSLPAFLREAYAFRAARILEAPCLFVMDWGAQPNTPAAIRKHLFEVGKRWDGGVVYVSAGIDSACRKQLIDQKVPFVIPGNQVFLPMLGIDLREHFWSVRGAAESLSPATQAAFLPAGNGRRTGLQQHDPVASIRRAGNRRTRAAFHSGQAKTDGAFRVGSRSVGEGAAAAADPGLAYRNGEGVERRDRRAGGRYHGPGALHQPR